MDRTVENFVRCGGNRHFFGIRSLTRSMSSDIRIGETLETIPPLLGERVGVRASVTTNFPSENFE